MGAVHQGSTETRDDAPKQTMSERCAGDRFDDVPMRRLCALLVQGAAPGGAGMADGVSVLEGGPGGQAAGGMACLLEGCCVQLHSAAGLMRRSLPIFHS